jgi:hypothetical protein
MAQNKVRTFFVVVVVVVKRRDKDNYFFDVVTICRERTKTFSMKGGKLFT